MKVKISIVIAVKNMADTIERAIKSVLDQTYENCELIVMDAESSDGTMDVIRKYKNRFAYWISESDQGPSDAIAKALPFASGELIGFLGADDWYEPYALQLVAEAYHREQADLYYGNMLVHDGQKTTFIDHSKFRADLLFWKGTQWLGAVCAFVRKELLAENYRKWNNTLPTDYLFFMRMYEDGRKFVHVGVKDPLTHFFIGGRTSTQFYRMTMDVRRVRLQILKEYPEIEKAHPSYRRRIDEVAMMSVVHFYSEIMERAEYQKKVRDAIGINETCVLFGAGHFGEICSGLLRTCGTDIEMIVDNDSAKWGDELEGTPVKAPQELSRIRGKCIIAAVSSDYEEAVIQQIEEGGYAKGNKLITFADIAGKLYEAFGQEVLEDAYEKGLIQ